MESNLQYAEKGYWEERFKEETNFEWLADFGAFQHLLLPYLKKESRILHIGCGSSRLSMSLYKLGYTNIANLDYSETLIEASTSKYPEMTWICDDIRTMNKIVSGSIDVVIEKATLEALLVAEKSQWDPSDYALGTLERIFGAIHRVLAPNGVYVSISFTQPHFRVPALLRQPWWDVEIQEFGSGFHFYVYGCRRDVATSPHIRDRFAAIAPSWRRSLLPAPGAEVADEVAAT